MFLGGKSLETSSRRGQGDPEDRADRPQGEDGQGLQDVEAGHRGETIAERKQQLPRVNIMEKS